MVPSRREQERRPPGSSRRHGPPHHTWPHALSDKMQGLPRGICGSMLMRLLLARAVPAHVITVLAGSTGWQYFGSLCKLLIIKHRRVAQLVRAPA